MKWNKKILFLLFLVVSAHANFFAAEERNNIIFMLDVSGTLAKNDPHNYRFLTTNILLDIVPKNINLGIYAFDYHIKSVFPFQLYSEWNDPSIIINRINHLKSNGLWTDIDIAVNKALSIFAEHPNKCNNHLIVFSDGLDDFEGTGFVYSMPVIRKENVRITTVAIGDSVNSALLKNLAFQTGGNFFYAKNRKDMIDKSLREVVQYFRELALLDTYFPVKKENFILQFTLNYPKVKILSDNKNFVYFLRNYFNNNTSMGTAITIHKNYAILELVDVRRDYYSIKVPKKFLKSNVWVIGELYPFDYPFMVTIKTEPSMGQIYINNQYYGTGYFNGFLPGNRKYLVSFGDLNGYRTPSAKIFNLNKNYEIKVEYKQKDNF